jgi:hypothetical protein
MHQEPLCLKRIAELHKFSDSLILYIIEISESVINTVIQQISIYSKSGIIYVCSTFVQEEVDNTTGTSKTDLKKVREKCDDFLKKSEKNNSK